MPHLTVHALDADLTGNEAALIAALTDVVAGEYGEWARAIVDVRLIGLASERWGIGGKPVESPAPSITFGIREAAFQLPDADQRIAALVAAVTDAIVGVFGEQVRAGVVIDFIGTPDGRTAVGGVLVAH